MSSIITALEMSFSWNVPGFVSTLPVMLKGLLGIFAVILVIWLFIAILSRITGKKK